MSAPPEMLPRRPDSPTGSPRPPAEVRASFWGFLTSALVLLINGLLALGSREAFRAAAKRMLTLTGRAAEVNAARLDELTTANVVMAVLVSAVIAGLLVLFAYKARSGRNWARVVLALAAVGAILQLATAPLSVPAFVGGALAVLAAVPLFLPRADAYFRAARSAR